MKLKYYLRGLGLGIIVTAVIMNILGSKDRKMTDEEIIARAKQLGLIESTVLTEGIGGEEDAGQPEDGEGQPEGGEGQLEGREGQPEDGEGQLEGREGQPEGREEQPEDGEGQPDGGEGSTDGQADAPADVAQSESGTDKPESVADADKPDARADAGGNGNDDNNTSTGSTVTASSFPKVLIIKSGEGSYTVSKKLKEIGAVESAEDFDTYLCENGYDKKIRAGTYTIPVDASVEQMAKIVTGAKITE